MNRKELESMGFALERQYEHDGFHTYVYGRGNVRVELTYRNKNLVSSEIGAVIDYEKIDLQKLKSFVELFPNL